MTRNETSFAPARALGEYEFVLAFLWAALAVAEAKARKSATRQVAR